MEQKISLEQAIDSMLNYWKSQEISSRGKKIEEIETRESELGVMLPADFKKLYQIANGMEYAGIINKDKEGFFFYPLEELVTYQAELGKNGIIGNKECTIFMDYLDKSWHFGVLTDKEKATGQYEIIIIPNAETYKTISKSLKEFIILYINDSEVLYDWK